MVDRIGSLIKKAPPRKEVIDLNATILEVTALSRNEAVKTGVTVGTQLAEGLPTHRIRSSAATTSDFEPDHQWHPVDERASTAAHRELLLSTARAEPEGVCVAVRDSGPGLARRDFRVSLTPSTPRSPTAWDWASRFAARLSKPMVGGCGRPIASRGVLSFSLRSPLTEPPSVDVAYWRIAAPDVCDGTSAVGDSRHRIPSASVGQPTKPCLGHGPVLGQMKTPGDVRSGFWAVWGPLRRRRPPLAARNSAQTPQSTMRSLEATSRGRGRPPQLNFLFANVRAGPNACPPRTCGKPHIVLWPRPALAARGCGQASPSAPGQPPSSSPCPFHHTLPSAFAGN